MHGMSKYPEYRVWVSMTQRCINPNNINYHNYGGRGITVCDRWKNLFPAFYKDMGVKPFSEAEIDRIDNNGNYEPSNCRWVTHAVNDRNRTTTKLTVGKVKEIKKLHKTREYTQKELSEKYKVSESTIHVVVNNKTWR